MADEEDIDIEEHDLMDNPRIRNILPSLELDLTTIKTEAPDEDENMSGNELDEAVNFSQTLRDAITYEESDIDDEHSHHYTAEYSNPNRIILGTKPNTHRNENQDTSLIFGLTGIKSEPADYEDMEVDPELELIETPERDVYASIVALEDWGPRLKRSSCYCKECKILFPTRNCLDAHKMASHSFLVALDVNKAVKSTAKSSTNEPSSSQSLETFCHHCKTSFATRAVLMKHLYDLIPILSKTVYKCECSATFTDEAEYKLHKESHTINEDDESQDNTEERKYYRCPVCSLQKFHQGSMKKHVEENHSIRNYNCDQVNYSNQCNFCLYTSNVVRNYNGHISTHHSEHFLKKIKSSPAKPLVNIVQTQNSGGKVLKYKCMKCHQIYSSKGSAAKHKRLKHQNLLNKKLFIKFYEDSTPAESSQPTQEVNKATLVPKDVIFQCDRCDIHFTSCSKASLHHLKCKRHKSDIICSFCNRTFKNNEKLMHALQHSVTQKFRVYIIQKNLEDIVLCQCPECNIYFTEEQFWVHAKQGCQATNHSKCSECNIVLSWLCIDKHKRMHEEENMQKDDFVLVKYVSVGGTKNTTAPKAIPKVISKPVPKMMPTGTEKLKEIGDRWRTYFYCTWCDCCIRAVQSIHLHRPKMCPTNLRKKHICKICGLRVSNPKHEGIHRRDPQLKLKDFTFVRVKDKKVINPPIPSYPKCNKCKVNFISKTAKVKHECGETYKTCKYCHEKFSDLALKLHIPLHEYAISKDKLSKPQKQPPKPIEVPDDDMPELLKKYNMLTKTWNILYLCEICNIVCDAYDLMVEHCQKHFSNLESFDMIVKECKLCDLNFDGFCFNRHKELHKTHDNLDKSSFDIITYNYSSLHDDLEWYKFFRSLPLSQFSQIVSMSIYRFVRHVKMTIIKDGPPEYTLYKCAQCNKHVHSSSLKEHSINNCSQNTFAHRCPVCHLVFTSRYGRDVHGSLHNEGEIIFRVVLFNDVNDEEFNRAMAIPSRCDDNVASTSKTIYSMKPKSKFAVKHPKDNSTWHYYKCRRCKCCYKSWSYARNHICRTSIACSICKLRFSKDTGHLTKHQNLHKVIKKKITVSEFDRKDARNTVTEIEESQQNKKVVDQPEKKEDKVVEVYKCNCGLHFINQNMFNTHSEVCGAPVSSENCSKCGLLFPTNVLVAHLCKHHGNSKTFQFTIVEPENNTEENPQKCIYKCKKCNICYLSMKAMSNHYRNDHKHLVDTSPCRKCGLQFTQWSMKRHLLMHHATKSQMKDIKVKTFGPNAFSKYDNNKDRVLYECTKCAIHTLTRNALVHHKKTECPLKEKIICGICNLYFHPMSIRKHKYIHHKQIGLKHKNDFIINQLAEEHSTVEKSAPVKTDKRCIVFKCKECNVHFMTKAALRSHVHLSRHTAPCREVITKKQKCNLCRLVFKTASIDNHKAEHHKNGRNKAKDFRIITTYSLSKANRESEEHVSQNEDLINNSDDGDVSQHDTVSQPQHDTVSQDDTVSHDTVDKDTDIPLTPLRSQSPSEIEDKDKYLYQCVECFTCNLTACGIMTHVRKNQHEQPKFICSVCSLGFTLQLTLQKHEQLHHSVLKMTAEAMKKHIIKHPELFPLSKYTNKLYKCSRCQCHITTSNGFSVHKCERSRAQNGYCTECKLTFTGSKMLHKHVSIHHDEMKLKREDFVILCAGELYRNVDNASSNYIEPVSTETVETSRIDDEKDSADDKFTGRLFKCTKCSVHLLTAGDFASHSDKCENIDTESCSTCNLVFDKRDIPTHKEIHHENLNISKDDFVITSNVKASFLPKDKIKRPEIFKCMKCGLHFLCKQTLLYHDHKSRRVQCSVCGLEFTKKSLYKHSIIHHELANLTIDDFDFVTSDDLKIIDTTDNTIDNSIDDLDKSDIDSISQCSVSTENTTNDKIKTQTLTNHMKNRLTSKEFDSTIYKCTRCPLHYLGLESIKQHERSCDDSIARAKCYECDLEFGVKQLPRHAYLHHEIQNLKKGDIKVVSREEMDVSKSDVSIEARVSQQDDILESKDNEKSKKNLSGVYNKLFKCAACEVHYLHENYLDAHIYTGTHKVPKLQCNQCGLKIVLPMVKIHRVVQHEQHGLNLEDFEIIVKPDRKEQPESSSPVTPKMDKSKKASISPKQKTDKLYKCSTCNVYFLGQQQCYKHTVRHTILDPKDYIECKLCHLQFMIVSLSKHITLHHASEFNVDDVLIEEYVPNADGTPKIDIYYAKDKLHNDLVSTTSAAEEPSSSEPDNTGSVETTGKLHLHIPVPAFD